MIELLNSTPWEDRHAHDTCTYMHHNHFEKYGVILVAPIYVPLVLLQTDIRKEVQFVRVAKHIMRLQNDLALMELSDSLSARQNYKKQIACQLH